jgi:fumarate hydratase, class II
MSVSTANHFRIEEDALGDVQVPAEHLWGAQTQRSHENFPIGVDRFRWGHPVSPVTAYRQDLSLREAALSLGYLTEEQFDAWVRPEEMTHPLQKIS